MILEYIICKYENSRKLLHILSQSGENLKILMFKAANACKTWDSDIVDFFPLIVGNHIISLSLTQKLTVS
jgi:hypothetical protein